MGHIAFMSHILIFISYHYTLTNLYDWLFSLYIDSTIILSILLFTYFYAG